MKTFNYIRPNIFTHEDTGIPFSEEYTKTMDVSDKVHEIVTVWFRTIVACEIYEYEKL